MKEIKNKTDQELKDLLSDKREALRVFRFGMSGSKVKNVKESLTTRKDIARMMTELNGRELKK